MNIFLKINLSVNNLESLSSNLNLNAIINKYKLLSIYRFNIFHKNISKYACCIIDFKTGNIIDIIEGRKLKNWDSYTQLLDKEELKKVKYISIDLFDTYREVKNIYFPNAILCCDSFHVIKNINKILKDERIKVMRRHKKDSVEYYLLKKFNYLLMMDSSNIKENKAKYNKKLKRYINYPQLLELILDIDSILKEAYELKVLYLCFNSTATIESSREELADIIKDYASSNIEGYRQFSTTLIKWFNEIINSFATYEDQRISNGKIEGKNSQIKTIIKNANGFRNFSRMRNRIIILLKQGFTSCFKRYEPNNKTTRKKTR